MNPLNAEKSIAIECSQVTKDFFYTHRTNTMREFFVQLLKLEKIRVRQFVYRLRQFDIQVLRSESVALLGNNGAGKSTILRLMAGIYEPTSGFVRTTGRVAAVLELGVGFHTELTGRENVDLYGSIIGIPTREMPAYRQRIFDFADLAKFIDLPTKYYSSGMVARLAFSVAVCANPDILLLDEVLAVGDGAFRQKCLGRLHELRKAGATLVVASHDFDVIRELCDRAVLLKNGAIIEDGQADLVIEKYKYNMDLQIA